MDAKFEDESDFKPRHACPERDEICRHRVVRREGSAHLGVTEEAIIQMSLAPEILRYRMGCSGRADTRGSHKKRLGWRGAASGPQAVAAAARNSIYVDVIPGPRAPGPETDHGPPAPQQSKDAIPGPRAPGPETCHEGWRDSVAIFVAAHVPGLA